MRKAFLLFISIALTGTGCNRMSTEEKITNLRGYWEIKKVEPENGNPTEYRFNEMVDYIEIENGAGYRRKVRPQLDGSYVTTEGVEIFNVKVENDSINLYYETPYDSWKETLISSGEDEVQMMTVDGTVYTYKRFTPISIENYGKED